MQTWHIHIEGQVQGVGFRPFVYGIAQEFGVNGWVNNTIDGVHIEFNADRKVAEKFYQKLVTQPPVLARITQHKITINKQKLFDNFQIIHSDLVGQAKLLVTPDFGMCQDCQTELHINSNHRLNYPFITCTNCGPRYSIIQKLPYDRATTTMDVFPMCPHCQQEYSNPLDRRYYSQTNSCQNCGIEMHLFDHTEQPIDLSQDEIINKIVAAWAVGKIVAIKGIGGYLLTCDARNEQAVQQLRDRKYRPSKPFALMFSTFNQIEQVANLSDLEKATLQSPVSPIVLLNTKKEKAEDYLALQAIAPNLDQIGIMRPYTPLFDLLLKKFGHPIVATSGNISNSPIVFDDQKAVIDLSQIADLIVTNNRKIVVPQDDSVNKFTLFKKQSIILRRSRGLAPTYINADLEWSKQTVLAAGAMLKSTFSLLQQKNTYVSQYLGDLGSFDTQLSYEHTSNHFLELFDAQPTAIVVDKHPEYSATLYGENWAKKFGCTVHPVQHHKAHFGAILGENNLIHSKESILGVIWDGTGLGDDQQIWGGEFFTYLNYSFTRSIHFDYFDFILGDKMPKEPRISALSASWQVEGAATILQPKFNQAEWSIYQKLLTKNNSLKTSSIGRIFDAVASLLGMMDQQTYEGEAAMQLEKIATDYFVNNGLEFEDNYFLDSTNLIPISTQSLFAQIIADLQNGKTEAFIAAKFHYSLVYLVQLVANHLKIKKIAFSGGVFQNGLLVDLLIHHLNADFELYFHRQLSPNDENISFGQLICYQISQLKKNAKFAKVLN